MLLHNPLHVLHSNRLRTDLESVICADPFAVTATTSCRLSLAPDPSNCNLETQCSYTHLRPPS
jgi:hypothetical protein